MTKEQRIEEYKNLKNTTTEYPCIIRDEYFFSKDDLDEYLEDNELKVEDVIIHGCYQKDYPKLEDDYWQESTNEDGELPKGLQKLIDEFNEKLKDIPKLWWEDCTTRFIYT